MIDILSELHEQVRVQPKGYVQGVHRRAAEEIARLREELDDVKAERDAARAKALDALAAEYTLTPPLHNGDMQNGRRDAVRGVAVRLGVYEGLDDAIDVAIRAMIEQEDKG